MLEQRQLNKILLQRTSQSRLCVSGNNKKNVVKTTIYFLIILVFFSCKREMKKTHIEKEKFDSIVVIKDENKQINCFYRFSNEKGKVLNELISFTKDGKIDYARSNFVEIVGNDLIFHSQYDKKYQIPNKRFLEFIGTKITNQSDSVQIIKPDTIFFNEDSKIENYKKIYLHLVKFWKL